MKTLARPGTGRDPRPLKRVRPESVRRWGRMSAHQMVCHLSDSLRMGMGEKPVSDATGLLQRTIVKWIAVWAPLPWPAGILTRPEIDQELAGTRPVDFATDLARLEALLVSSTAQTRSFAAAPSDLRPMSNRAAAGATATSPPPAHFRGLEGPCQSWDPARRCCCCFLIAVALALRKGAHGGAFVL